jgi:hypothetical protein
MKTHNNKQFKMGLFVVLTILTVGLFFSSCKKDDDSEAMTNGYMQLEMTDTPGDYAHVYIDIVDVQVHQSDDENSGWVSLNTRDTIYDLLMLQNDITTILADSTLLPTGKLTQLRLILGNRNSVVLNDSSVYPLTIPSGSQTGLKINLNATIAHNQTTRVLIDFNADQSIHMEGNGSYKLSPVIKVKRMIIQ